MNLCLFVSNGVLPKSLRVGGKRTSIFDLAGLGPSSSGLKFPHQSHKGVKSVTSPPPPTPQPHLAAAMQSVNLPPARTGAFSHFVVTGTIRGDRFYF